MRFPRRVHGLLTLTLLALLISTSSHLETERALHEASSHSLRVLEGLARANATAAADLRAALSLTNANLRAALAHANATLALQAAQAAADLRAQLARANATSAAQAAVAAATAAFLTGALASAEAAAAACAQQHAALGEREAACSAVAHIDDERLQCDVPGEAIDAHVCAAKGCCWRPGASYWCFHSPLDEGVAGPQGRLALFSGERPARMAAAPPNATRPPTFAVMALFKDEDMNMREWLEHYTWQGADYILLLDNGSTRPFAHIVADFPNAAVLPAPLNFKQREYYSTAGREWLEARAVDLVLVADLDEFFWGEGASLKDHFVGAMMGEGGAAQAICRYEKFGSNGFSAHPASLRECLTRRGEPQPEVETDVSYFKSVVRLAALRRFEIHFHLVEGPSVTCPPGVRYFHYKTQSREFWERVKMARGDSHNPALQSHRDWRVWDAEEARGNDTDDTALRDALRAAGLARGEC